MRIEFTGRQTEIPKRVQVLAERKLTKLARGLRGITRVHVILGSDKHRQLAEVTLHSPHLTLTAGEETGDLGASLAAALEKLARQARRRTSRLRARKRRPAQRPALRSRREA